MTNQSNSAAGAVRVDAYLPGTSAARAFFMANSYQEDV